MMSENSRVTGLLSKWLEEEPEQEWKTEQLEKLNKAKTNIIQNDRFSIRKKLNSTELLNIYDEIVKKIEYNLKVTDIMNNEGVKELVIRLMSNIPELDKSIKSEVDERIKKSKEREVRARGEREREERERREKEKAEVEKLRTDFPPLHGGRKTRKRKRKRTRKGKKSRRKGKNRTRKGRKGRRRRTKKH